jgi:hypothetical protein
MSLTKNIKQKAANYFFYRELQKYKHVTRSVAFDDARTIGILYDATVERNYELVKMYVKRLRDEFKKDDSGNYFNPNIPGQWIQGILS